MYILGREMEDSSATEDSGEESQNDDEEGKDENVFDRELHLTF